MRYTPKKEINCPLDNDTLRHSKYVLQKMAMRNDVTISIQFNYKNISYVIVFPAKTDYTKLLQGKDNFFGFLGLNGCNGKVL